MLHMVRCGPFGTPALVWSRALTYETGFFMTSLACGGLDLPIGDDHFLT